MANKLTLFPETRLPFSPKSEIRSLCWKNPFGLAMFHGKTETRTWPTNYRGWVLICTTKKPFSQRETIEICGFDLYYTLLEAIKKDCSQDLNGFAIGIARLTDCRPMLPEDEAKCFVRYRQGLYCHIYEDARAIMPIPWKGSQKWGMVSIEICERIENEVKPKTEYAIIGKPCAGFIKEALNE